MEFVLKGMKKGRKGWVIVSDAYSKNVCVPSGIISSVLLLRKLWFKEVTICPECKLCKHNAQTGAKAEETGKQASRKCCGEAGDDLCLRLFDCSNEYLEQNSELGRGHRRKTKKSNGSLENQLEVQGK